VLVLTAVPALLPAARGEDRPAAKAAPALPAPDWPFPPSGLRGNAIERARLSVAASWINGEALFTVAQDASGQVGIVGLDPSLKGKAVLLHFWDYTNAHCVRLLPLLSRWHDLYARDGLVIVGVHAPQYAFSAERENVAAAVGRLGVRYPVYLDSDFLLWQLFRNMHWPRSLLIGPGGRMAHDSIGTARTRDLERAIRGTLGAPAGKRAALPPLQAPIPDPETTVCRAVTPDTACGARRGRLGSPGYAEDGAATDYRIPPHAEVRRDGVMHLAGRWRATAHALFPVGKGPWELRLKFHAAGVKLVLAPPPGPEPARVRVSLDGGPVPARFMGPDLREEPAGQSTLTLDTPRLVHLIARQPVGTHEIGLQPQRAGTGFYAFYFEGCEPRAEAPAEAAAP
jgi:thiol-disulfide isomerase/thioredoxin